MTRHQHSSRRISKNLASGLAFCLLAVSPAAAQTFPTGAMMSMSRGAMISANVSSGAQVAILRQRDEYADLEDMIEGEIRILSSELEALRVFNNSAEGELAESRRELQELKSDGLARRRSEVSTLRRRVDEQRAENEARLRRAENELATTNRLRGSAEVSDEAAAEWREREARLKSERDRLRELLKRVANLTGSLG